MHNFHRMDPHKAGINLHLAEAIKRAKDEGKAFAEPRIYIADQSDLKAFAAFVDSIGNGSPARAMVPMHSLSCKTILT